MTWLLGGRPLRRILVTRLRYLGDVAMSTVVVDVLRRGDPELEIGFLCEQPFGELLRDHPWLERLHLLASGPRHPARRHGRRTPPPVAPRTTPWLVRELRRTGYDAAVDLFFNPRSAWLLRLAGIPRRLAGSRGWRSRLYTDVHEVPGDDPGFLDAVPGGLGAHVARLWPLRHAESGLSLRDWVVDEGRRKRWRTYLPPREGPWPRAVLRACRRLEAEEPGGYVLLAPGATWPTKRWSPRRWAEVAQALAREGRSVLVLQPPAGDPDLAAAFRDQPPGVVLLPVLDLGAALRVVAACACLVSCDGGIMHAGVAMGRPTVGLFGPTDPSLWFPYAHLGPFRVLAARPDCHPCDRHVCDEFVCMPAITVEMVLEAARELSGEASP